MTVADFIDPMDAVINQLQPRDTRPAEPTTEPTVQDQIVTDPTLTTEPTVEPIEPTTEPTTTPEVPAFDFDKELDELLDLVKTDKDKRDDITKEKDVNTKPEKKQLVVPKILEKPDSQELSVDEREEITNYIYDIEEQLANLEFDKKRAEVEKNQTEQLLERERAKNSEIYDKLKDLEREMKKTKSVQYPDELQTLVDLYKLNKENWTLYNKRNLVWEASKIVEQITERPMDPYLLDRLKSGSYFDGASGGASLDMPKAEPKKESDQYNVMQF